MKQAIAGVTPHKQHEAPIITIWPTNGAYPLGKFLGQLFSIEAGTYIFTVGNLFALLSIPLALAIFFYRIAPYVGTRYRVTNRRIVIQRGIMGVDDAYLNLDGFDDVEIVVQSGQEWYHCGDMIFRQGNVERLRLAGVPRPKAFLAIVNKAQAAHVGVNEALAAAS